MKLRRYLTVSATFVLAVACMSAASAYSIVNVPTANQAAVGEVNLAYYNMSVKNLPVTHKDIYVAYSTVIPGLEVEWIHVDINKGAPSQNLINASYKVLSENLVYPDVVIGAKNLFADDHSPNPDEQKASFYVAAAKTLNPPKAGMPWTPVVRVHLSYGTREHRGFFGGAQVALTPNIGVFAMKFTSSPYAKTFFGNTYEYGAVYSMGKGKPDFKVGKLGDHFWGGVSYSLFY